jgi:hypothetical protein
VGDGREVGGRKGEALPALSDGYEWIKMTKKDGSFMDVILTIGVSWRRCTGREGSLNSMCPT